MEGLTTRHERSVRGTLLLFAHKRSLFMRLYSVSDKYINYLRNSYPRIYSNKEDSRVHTRKYLGAVIELSGYKYYIPLSSPKLKHDYVMINGEKKIRNNYLSNRSNTSSSLCHFKHLFFKGPLAFFLLTIRYSLFAFETIIF